MNYIREEIVIDYTAQHSKVTGRVSVAMYRVL